MAFLDSADAEPRESLALWPTVSCSRGLKGDVEEFRRCLSVLEALGNHAKGQSLHPGDCFVPVGAVSTSRPTGLALRPTSDRRPRVRAQWQTSQAYSGITYIQDYLDPVANDRLLFVVDQHPRPSVDHEPRFDYRVRDGVSTQRLGMTLLRQERVLELLEQSAPPLAVQTDDELERTPRECDP